MLEPIRQWLGDKRQKWQRMQSTERLAEKTSATLKKAIEANERACDENARVREMLEDLLHKVRRGAVSL